MLAWWVVADDRTGALEVAGECAAFVGPVSVRVGLTAQPLDLAMAVADLGTRHVSAAHAATVAAAAERTSASRVAHKIDSLLRGNWAHELTARHRQGGRRILVVPAFPALGRTCVDGVVRAHEVPVGGRDPRGSVASARPADHLAAAGIDQVVQLTGADGIDEWIRGSAPVAVCDAASDDDLAEIGRACCAYPDVLFAGTAGSIAAAVAAGSVSAPRVPAPCVRAPVLIVCGSLHPMARMQLGNVGGSDVVVIASPVPDGDAVAVSAVDAEWMAVHLAAEAASMIRSRTFATVVVIGGDTAAAVLGDGERIVGGTVAPGMPWSSAADGSGPLVVTKAGGFGNPTTLRELLGGR